MSRPRTLTGAGLAALAAAALAFAPAANAADNGAKIVIKGGIQFNQGKSVVDDQRFVGTTTVKPGGTIKVANKAKTEDPHTVSFLAKKDLPKSFADLGSPAIGALMGAHEVPQGEGPPGKPVVNAGAEGFDTAGDSYFFVGKSYSIPVAKTAKKGTYHYVCLIHPWMQGTVKVK